MRHSALVRAARGGAAKWPDVFRSFRRHRDPAGVRAAASSYVAQSAGAEVKGELRLLIVAIEDERLGPVRLAKYLQGAGLKVASLSGKQNPLRQTRFVDKQFHLPASRNCRTLAQSLEAAISTWNATFVIPADEQVFALLAALLTRTNDGTGHPLSDATRRILQRSLGPANSYKAKLSKNAAQRLARSVGVRCAPGESAATKAEAQRIAREVGFPVVLKTSFSWSGAGVRKCNSSEEVERAFDEMAPVAGSGAKNFIRRLIGRDWYPEPEPIWVQKAIDGMPAMYTFVAYEGRVLAGFSAIKRRTVSSNGPSSVIDCKPNSELSHFSSILAGAMDSVGFNSFDFMIEAATGHAYFLECNPRPNPVSHLGAHLGDDLCGHLANVLADDARAFDYVAAQQCGAQTIALFPQEWRRDAVSPFISEHYHDVPWDDARLVAFLMSGATP